jgi:hypothetical protein
VVSFSPDLPKAMVPVAPPIQVSIPGEDRQHQQMLERQKSSITRRQHGHHALSIGIERKIAMVLGAYEQGNSEEASAPKPINSHANGSPSASKESLSKLRWGERASKIHADAAFLPETGAALHGNEEEPVKSTLLLHGIKNPYIGSRPIKINHFIRSMYIINLINQPFVVLWDSTVRLNNFQM